MGALFSLCRERLMSVRIRSIVYLTMVSVAQAALCQMIGRVMSSKLNRMWPIVVYYPRIRMEKLRKTTRYLSQDSGSHDGDYYLRGRLGWRGGNAPDSYSGCTEFKSRPGY